MDGGGRALRDYGFEYRVSDLALRNAEEVEVVRRERGKGGPELRETGFAASHLLQARECIIK